MIQTYQNVILSEANYGGLPVGYWRLNEANGTTAKDLIGGNNGTYTGTAGTGYFQNDATLVNRAESKYLRYAANVQSVNFGNVTALHMAGLQPFTLECFFRIDFTPAYGPNLLAMGTMWFVSYSVSGGTMNFGRGSTGQVITLPSTGVMHHGAWVFTGTQKKSYIDGVNVATQAATDSLTDTSSNFRFGANRDGFVSHAGSGGEFALYNYALSADRVLYHYLAGKNGLKQQHWAA